MLVSVCEGVSRGPAGPWHKQPPLGPRHARLPTPSCLPPPADDAHHVTDLSGDSGAIGRLVIAGTKEAPEMQIDLKGAALPCPTAFLPSPFPCAAAAAKNLQGRGASNRRGGGAAAGWAAKAAPGSRRGPQGRHTRLDRRAVLAALCRCAIQCHHRALPCVHSRDQHGAD